MSKMALSRADDTFNIWLSRCDALLGWTLKITLVIISIYCRQYLWQIETFESQYDFVQVVSHHRRYRNHRRRRPLPPTKATITIHLHTHRHHHHQMQQGYYHCCVRFNRILKRNNLMFYVCHYQFIIIIKLSSF